MMHVMEASDRKNGDQSDLWIMLDSLGLNSDLIMDKVNQQVEKVIKITYNGVRFTFVECEQMR